MSSYRQQLQKQINDGYREGAPQWMRDHANDLEGQNPMALTIRGIVALADDKRVTGKIGEAWADAVRGTRVILKLKHGKLSSGLLDELLLQMLTDKGYRS